MLRKFTSICLTLSLVLAAAASVPAGGALETVDITGRVPAPVTNPPGLLIGRVIGIKWDARSIPVQYSLNTTLDPIPNPHGAPFLALAQAGAALQSAFDAWNRIPTSFIEMQITKTSSNPGLRGFDFVNELTFRTANNFGAIASSPSVNLIEDTTLANGEDIDGDMDSDVSNTIAVCADVDNDGDIEFPAGDYKAGTILENDVQFNTNEAGGLRFTVDDAAVDTVGRSVDLLAVAVHEFGHSHGLSHVLENQLSDSDGTGTTMFPFVDTTDPASELAQRSLGTDDITWSSYFYPEGSAGSGPAALRRGDIPFNLIYGLIKGELRHGVLNQPIAGGSLSAAFLGTSRIVASGFSGRTQFAVDPVTGGLRLVSPAFNIIDGSYTIPVPLGVYAVGVEAVDGAPVPANAVSFTTQIGAIFGQQNFNEEYYNGSREGALEARLGERKIFPVLPGRTQGGINITTSDVVNVNNFGNRTSAGFIDADPGFLYALQIPAAQVAAFRPGEEIQIQGVAYDTIVVDASVVPVFGKALLTTGVVNPDGTVKVDLEDPLERDSRFVGQDGDFAPFYFKTPQLLGKRVRRQIEEGKIQNLFIVLQVANVTPFPGVSAVPPLIGLDATPTPPPAGDLPNFGLSYVSGNGGETWVKDTRFNFRFSLILSAAVKK